MGNLQQTLPNVIQEALKDEDKTTKALVLLLLDEARLGRKKMVAQKALDDFFERFLK